jgi:hypothetical protein
MRVCFVAENAWSAIAEDGRLPFGGMETQAWSFAQCLQALRVCEVSFSVSTPFPFRSQQRSGIEVLNRSAWIEHMRRNVARHCVIGRNWPPVKIRKWNRSLAWQLPLLAATRPFRSPAAEQRSIAEYYSHLPADVVIAYGVSSLTTAIVEAARSAGKRTIISCASNDDLRVEYRTNPDYVNAYGDRADVLYRGLMQADRILVQTPHQQQLARANLELDACVIPNPIDERWIDWARQSETLLQDVLKKHSELEQPFVLWTGRTDRFHKRPAIALQIAEQLPQVQFVMVLDVTDAEIHAELTGRMPANVLMLSPLRYPQFVALMSRATAFLSTGSKDYEGFPNVFLQAGLLGVSVLSAECDFGILSETGIGRAFSNSVSELVQHLQQQMTRTAEQDRQIDASDTAERLLQRYGSQAIAATLWQALQE